MRKNKKLNVIVPMGTYPFDVMFSFNQTDAELGAELDKYGALPVDEIEAVRFEGNGVGRFVRFSMGATLIRLKHYPETPKHYGHLQHEIFHAAMVSLEKMGVRYKFGKSDEAFAYLIQYLTQQIYQLI